MSLALDHVVIAVGDLAATVEDYRELGFTVLIGGSHPGRTSHNALVVFADGSYLELIAWKAPAPEERWHRLRESQGDGYVDFALLPDDLPARVAGAKARGLALDGPIDGGRVRPDGLALRWQTARQKTFDLPFLCADVTPRVGRVPEGDCRQHANGATGISRVTVAVHDVAAATARYGALLGLDLPDTGPSPRDIPLAGFTVTLVAGEPGAGGGAVGPRGEGVRALTLRVASGVAPRVLDLTRAHGAALRLEPAAA